MLGSGAIIVIDDRCCMVQLGLRVAQFYMHESCGKCTPCREGTRWMGRILHRSRTDRLARRPRAAPGRLRPHPREVPLPLGDAAAMPVASYIDKFRAEFQEHLERGCPMGGEFLARGRSRACRPARAPRSPRSGMSAPTCGHVKVTIDGREVEVAKGPGSSSRGRCGGRDPCLLLRAAARTGRRRLPDVPRRGRGGAQASGRLHADRAGRDGRPHRRRSAKAAEGQNATLEFILVNHPLDCPVCDKGGECPLQDLTFSYGPGQTRMTFPKRTFDKPIPISPTIALDRERCILCYRCTRFSSDVAEDGQLVARNRGAQSMIATFEDEPYAAPFSGNVIELCPSARSPRPSTASRAALGDPERAHRLRPLPRRLQHLGDDPRGQGQADHLAQPPRGGRGLALRQGPLRVPAHLRRRLDRRPARARRRRGFARALLGRGAGPGRGAVRGAQGRIVTALSGSETRRAGVRARQADAPGSRRALRRPPRGRLLWLDAFSAPLSTIGAAASVVVIGDEQALTGPRSSTLDPPRAAQRCRGRPGGGGEAGQEARAARLGLGPRLLIWSGRGGGGGAGSPSSATGSGSTRRPAAPRSTCLRRRTRAASPTPGPPARTRRRRTRSRSAC